MTSLLPYGDRAVLLEADDTAHALGLYRAVVEVAERGLPGLVEAVPAARTVLVRFDSAASCAAARESLRRLDDLVGMPEVGGLAAPPAARAVTIPVIYDGADLAEVAAMTGLSAGEVVARHTGRELEVAFIGFAPGFAYLTGLDPALQVPRRDSPRTAVPAGSVAIAAEFAAVYPSESPGGWRLLGRTETVTFDVHRDPPALLRPGMRVRFEAVRA